LVSRRRRGRYLAQFRARNWSQNEVARRIGLAPGLLSRWLRGEYVSRHTEEAIAGLLAEPSWPWVPEWLRQRQAAPPETETS